MTDTITSEPGASIVTPGISFVLEALGYGAMGVAAIVLCLSYLLVRQLANANPPRPANDGTLDLVQKYMRFALVCTAAMVVLQVGDGVVKYYQDERIDQLEGRVLNRHNFDSVSEWHWHWGAGGWETKAMFHKQTDGRYAFSATTTFRGAVIQRWQSSEPFVVEDAGSDIIFEGVRHVVADEALCNEAKVGPPGAKYPTRFVLKRSWALSGVYSGPNGEGPSGDMILYAPLR